MTDVDYFLREARKQASLSKKPNTKVGALLVDSSGEILLAECNDYIDPVYSNPLLENEANRKLYSEHAERRIIYAALNNNIANVSDKTLVITHFPCTDCARAIILIGIRNLIVDKIDIKSKFYIDRLEDLKTSYRMLKLNGVNIALSDRTLFESLGVNSPPFGA